MCILQNPLLDRFSGDDLLLLSGIPARTLFMPKCNPARQIKREIRADNNGILRQSGLSHRFSALKRGHPPLPQGLAAANKRGCANLFQLRLEHDIPAFRRASFLSA